MKVDDLAERVAQCNAAVHHWIAVANEYGVPRGRTRIEAPEIRYDLRGQKAGMWRPRYRHLRFNIDLLVTAFDYIIDQTVPHEVAHVVQGAWYGPATKPHGRGVEMGGARVGNPGWCPPQPGSAAGA